MHLLLIFDAVERERKYGLRFVQEVKQTLIFSLTLSVEYLAFSHSKDTRLVVKSTVI
jgi:hypothetical protein